MKAETREAEALKHARVARDGAQKVLNDAFKRVRAAQAAYDFCVEEYCVALEAEELCPHCHREWNGD